MFLFVILHMRIYECISYRAVNKCSLMQYCRLMVSGLIFTLHGQSVDIRLTLTQYQVQHSAFLLIRPHLFYTPGLTEGRWRDADRKDRYWCRQSCLSSLSAENVHDRSYIILVAFYNDFLKFILEELDATFNVTHLITERIEWKTCWNKTLVCQIGCESSEHTHSHPRAQTRRCVTESVCGIEVSIHSAVCLCVDWSNAGNAGIHLHFQTCLIVNNKNTIKEVITESKSFWFSLIMWHACSVSVPGQRKTTKWWTYKNYEYQVIFYQQYVFTQLWQVKGFSCCLRYSLRS